MHIDYHPFDNWHEINRRLAKHFDIYESKNEIRIYKSLPHALFEICLGLIKLFQHKNSIYYFRNTSPYLPLLIQQMRLENTKAQALDVNKMNDDEALCFFFRNLKSEDLFLIYFKEDPLLGKKFPVHRLENLFGKESSYGKSLFLISVSHGGNLSSCSLGENSDYRIAIQSFGEKGVLAFLGSRSKKIEALISPYLKWKKQDFENFKTQVQWSSTTKEEFQLKKKLPDEKQELNRESLLLKKEKKKILDFEKTKAGDFKAFFSPKEEGRIYDRAVIYWKDMDGFAFIDELSKELHFSLLPPGEEKRLETTSLSRWGGMKTMDWLKVYNLSNDQIRGLVMIDCSLIDLKLPGLISKVRKKILKLQKT